MGKIPASSDPDLSRDRGVQPTRLGRPGEARRVVDGEGGSVVRQVPASTQPPLLRDLFRRERNRQRGARDRGLYADEGFGDARGHAQDDL